MGQGREYCVKRVQLPRGRTHLTEWGPEKLVACCSNTAMPIKAFLEVLSSPSRQDGMYWNKLLERLLWDRGLSIIFSTHAI